VGNGVCRKKPIGWSTPQFAQPFAQRNEVIIMHPDQIARAEQGRQLAGKGVVHAEIALHFRRLNSTRLADNGTAATTPGSRTRRNIRRNPAD